MKILSAYLASGPKFEPGVYLEQSINHSTTNVSQETIYREAVGRRYIERVKRRIKRRTECGRGNVGLDTVSLCNPGGYIILAIPLSH